MSSDLWLRLRREESEQFHSLVKMHLSFLLDLNTDDCDCSSVLGHGLGGDQAHPPPASRKKSGAGLFSTTPKRFRRGVMDGLPLTMEGVCQIFQLILYLSSDERIVTEGIFRKHGSLKKAQSLRERLNKGLPLDLDDEEFSVHEVASVFKTFLADLPEPLLTDAYYGAHVQVTSSLSDEDPKKKQSLQLLFLLIPEPNYRLLKDTLLFLHKVALRQDRNKMSASNLGTVFSTHILCPRKLSAEALKSNHVLLTKSVAYMIEKAPELFDIPSQLMTDIQLYWNQRKTIPFISVEKSPPGSPVVNTVFTFVDRQTTKELSKDSTTDTALAALYAHVQALPESTQKKKLIQRLNEANGCGTPGRTTPVSQNTNKKPTSRRQLALKNLLTPKRSNSKEDALSGRIGSYNFSTPFKGGASSQLHSFKRQNSANAVSPRVETHNQKLLSPQSSPAILVSPQSLEAAIISPKAAPLDYKSPPAVPIRVSSLQASKDHSPITSVALKMPSDMQETLMTPRCRRPVMAMINDDSSVDSPCQPSKYNEDEPFNSPLFEDAEENPRDAQYSSSSSSNCDESDKYFESLEDDESDLGNESLLPEFKKYLLEKVASKNINESLSQEANDLLNGELELSESMQIVLDGQDPEPSVLEPVDVDAEEDINSNDENAIESSDASKLQQRKRRSLTERSSNNPLAPSNKSSNTKSSIYFETDL